VAELGLAQSGIADTYHHGNLWQVLLDQAVELARAGGPDAVVLRDVQRLAGVSNSAAYRHYSDRDALLAAVTEYAEARLADAMLARLGSVSNRGAKNKRAEPDCWVLPPLDSPSLCPD